MSSARRSACKNATRRRPSARCRLRASVGRARRRRPDAARPRERRRVRRRRHVVVIDIIHAAEYVWKTPRVFHRSTGVIEGVCRYVVRDRMESTGARWRLVGVEVILKPRALRVQRGLLPAEPTCRKLGFMRSAASIREFTCLLAKSLTNGDSSRGAARGGPSQRIFAGGRVLPLAEPRRHTWRGSRAHGDLYSIGVQPAWWRPTADRLGPCGISRSCASPRTNRTRRPTCATGPRCGRAN